MMSSVSRIPVCLLSLLLLAGCATVQVGEYNLLKESWDNDQVAVRERASFELKCPKETLHLTVLAGVYPAGSGSNRAKQIGVDGCEHRIIYVGTPEGWVLNSSDTEKK